MSPTATHTDVEVFSVADSDREGAIQVSELLHRSSGQKATGKLICPDGRQVQVPASVFSALQHVAELLAQGSDVSVSAVTPELSTSEAARLLGVSRPTLVQLLTSDQIPHRKVGTHHRIKVADVVEYQQRQLAGRRAAYLSFMEDADALGIHD